MKTIESEVIGTLTQNEQFENWWTSSLQNIKLVDQELTVTFLDVDLESDPEFLKDADAALSNFLSLDSMYKLKIAQQVFENFVEFISYIDESAIPPKMKGAQPLSIWNFVHPSAIFVNRRTSNDKDVYVVLACECEWEKEHGLQLVFRQGKKLTRVSDQDGHLTEADAYDVPDSEDKLLSGF